MTATEKLDAKIAAQTTEALIEIGTRLNLDCTADAILVVTRVERELERRMTPDAFVAYLADMEAMLDLAA
jgi:hypothetical protein